MPPVLIGAGIAAVGSIGGALISSGSQKSAANQAAAAQQQATDSQLQLGRENINFQQGIYNQNKALLTPFVDRGNAAGGQINALLGLGGSPQAAQPAAQQATPGAQTASPYTQQPASVPMGGDTYGQVLRGRFGQRFNAEDGLFSPDQTVSPAQQPLSPAQPQTAANLAATTTPATAPAGQTSQQAAGDAFNNFAHSAGIDFQLQQGTNALQHSAAARGLLQSGATLKALQGYGQNTALNNYFLPYMGLLQGQQATGAQSGAAISGVGSNFGNTVSNIYGGQANAIQNGANATSNAALLRGQANANLGNSIGSALGTFGSSFFPSTGGARY
jgi:hypothetical protein